MTQFATLAQIVEATNATEARFDPQSCRQVSDVRLVASMEDEARYYVVLGKTFRQISAYAWHYAVEVTKDGIECHSESSPRSAEAIAYMLMDIRRAKQTEEN